MIEIREIIGAQIAEIRKQKGLTQEELGARAGLSRVSIGKIERGISEPTITNLWQIALVLECKFILELIPLDVSKRSLF